MASLMVIGVSFHRHRLARRINLLQDEVSGLRRNSPNYHLIILIVIGLTATTTPLRSQGLTKSGCDEVVMTITELSRAAAGMLIHVENMNLPRGEPEASGR